MGAEIWEPIQRGASIDVKFNLRTQNIDGITILHIGGVIDEDNQLARSLSKIEGDTAILDLSEVKRINSCGVRDWVNWVQTLEARGKKLILEGCSPAVVAQINLVHNFVGQATVKSFYAPYYCSHCDKEETVLLQPQKFAGMKQLQAPDIRGSDCTKKNCHMSFDDIEEAYFAFLPHSIKQGADGEIEDQNGIPTPALQKQLHCSSAIESSSEEQKNSLLSNHKPEEEPEIMGSSHLHPPEFIKTRTLLLKLGVFMLVGSIIGYLLFYFRFL